MQRTTASASRPRSPVSSAHPDWRQRWPRAETRSSGRPTGFAPGSSRRMPPSGGRSGAPSTSSGPRSRRKPRAPGTVVGNDGTGRVVARPVPRKVILDDPQGFGRLDVGRSRSVQANLPAPFEFVTRDLARGGDGHRFAFHESRAVSLMPAAETDLVAQDVPSTVRQHGIGRLDEPDAGGDRERVENSRLSGTVVTHEQSEPRVQVQRSSVTGFSLRRQDVDSCTILGLMA